VKRPYLSPTQKRFLVLAFVREARLRRQHVPRLEDPTYGRLYAVKRDRNTVRVLVRLRLVITPPNVPDFGVTYYWLSDAGELLARALLVAASKGT